MIYVPAAPAQGRFFVSLIVSRSAEATNICAKFAMAKLSNRNGQQRWDDGVNPENFHWTRSKNSNESWKERATGSGICCPTTLGVIPYRHLRPQDMGRLPSVAE